MGTYEKTTNQNPKSKIQIISPVQRILTPYFRTGLPEDGSEILC
ncbi:MAG: hypothetical protein IEMM0006_0854 [bacterium]|nr:MAG: hypothetical protein IEMM0006_0854 [bacterium]